MTLWHSLSEDVAKQSYTSVKERLRAVVKLEGVNFEL